MTKREQNRQRRRQEIMQCAMDLFIARGYAATGIRDIATRLGMSTGLFFNYFKSKEQVYLELVELGVQVPTEMINQCMQAPTPFDVFYEIAKGTTGALRESSFTAKMFLLMMQAINSEDVPDLVKQRVCGFDVVMPMLDLIAKGQELGQIRTGDPLAISVAFWGAIQGIAEHVALNPELPLPEPEWIVQILKPDTN